jgi:recombination protein RecA
MPKVTTLPKTVDDVLGEFEKKTGLIVGTPEQVTAHTTGNLALDWQSGVGGIPRGRITELYGYESSGKTTTALQTAVELQQQIIDDGSDERIIYLDFEHALDVDYASGLGIDFSHQSFVPLQPRNLEQGGMAALDLIETGKVPLIVFDSVAAMAPRRKQEGDFDQATIQMHRAKLVSALCQSMIDSLHTTNCAAIFINHKMESIDMSGRPGLPPKVTTPGGRGLKFYASLRLEFDVGAGIKDAGESFLSGEEENQLVGQRVYVKCVKNKVGSPGRTVELRSRFGMGFDNAWSALQVLLSRKLVQKAGAWYTFTAAKTPELTLGQDRYQVHGEPNVLAQADADHEWRTALIARAQAAIAEPVETA